MPAKRLFILLSWVVLALLSAGAINSRPVTAQTETNLLRDPGFENQNVWKNVATAADNSATFNVAPDWEGWYTESPRTQPWQNLLPNGFPFSENGAGFSRSGNRSQEISRGSSTFTAAVYQVVAVQPNSNVTGSAWVRMNLNLNQNPGAQARVGIDPNGGTNPFDSDIVWSNWAVNAVNGFQQMTVSATTTGAAATLWLYATQAFPADPNGVYWDDAALIGGGPGGAAAPGTGTPGAPAGPTATPVPQVAAFVVPQGAQPDGSVVHTVQAGDTINAISVAYAVSVEEILRLNNLANARIIQIGQRLIIRPAQAGSSGESGGSAAPTRTPRAAVGSTAGSANPQPTTVAQGPTTAAQPTTAPQQEAPTAEPQEPTPTFTPQPTSTPAPPAPVAMADTEQEIDPAAQQAAVCVALYEDSNKNRIQDQGEDALEGGEIVLNLGGEVLQSYAPDGSVDPFCFDNLDSGEYVAVASAPDNYGLTTANQFRVRVQPGTTINIAFGAAEGVAAAAPPPADAGTGLVEEVATAATPEEESTLDQLLQVSGLVVFGLAGITLLGGLTTILLMRRR